MRTISSVILVFASACGASPVSQAPDEEPALTREPILVVLESAPRFVTAAGEGPPLFTPRPESYSRLELHAELAVVHSSWEEIVDEDLPPRYPTESVVLDRQGAIVCSTLVSSWVTDTTIAADGTVFITPYDVYEGTRLCHPDGATSTWEEFRVIGPLLADGHAVVRSTSSPEASGFARIGATELTAFAHPRSGDEGVLRMGAEHVAYTSRAAGVPMVVVERPGSAEVIALPGATEDDTVYVEESHASTLLVKALWSAERSWLVDALALSASPLELTPPEGMRLLAEHNDWCRTQPRFDSTGALIVVMRDGSSAALFRSTNLGTSWTQVGARYTDVQNLSWEEAAGVFVVRSDTWDEGDTFCDGQQTWESWPPGALVGASLTLVTRDGTLVDLALESSASLSPDGRMVALHGANGSTVHDLLSREIWGFWGAAEIWW
jgi:hypothetical protein